MNFTWSGLAFIKIDEMIPLTATDFPDLSSQQLTSGASVSNQTNAPSIDSFAKRNFLTISMGPSWIVPRQLGKGTIATSVFGTSIPTVIFPGIGLQFVHLCFGQSKSSP